MRGGVSQTEGGRRLIEHKFVLKTICAKTVGNPPNAYSGVSIDSRLLKSGDLFFAIKGEKDGHDYVRAAFKAGAAAAVVESGYALPGVPLICVSSTTRALADTARNWRKKFKNLKVICVTGSSGKTTTKQALAAIFESSGRRAVVNRKSFNNHLGLPLTLLDIRPEHEVCVAEVGINSPGEMEGLASIAAPDIGAVTNIGTAHIGRFGSGEKISEEKSLLFRSFGKESHFAVNLDDRLARKISDSLDCGKTGFSTVLPEAEVFAFGINGTERSLSFTMRIGGSDFPVTAPAVGRHNVMNFLCAAAISLSFGLSGDEIASGIRNFQPAEMRMEVAEIMGGVTLINDCYNANPDSVSAALEDLCHFRNVRKTTSSAIAVLGDMLELGDMSGMYHRAVGEKAAACGVDFLIGFGERAGDVCAAAGSKIRVEKTVSHNEAADIIKSVAKPGDFVLVKGSRGMKMEKIIRRISVPQTR